MAAIANVYEEAKRYDADAKDINPMELWDLHHIRRLDDSGFVDGLYRHEGDAKANRNKTIPNIAASRSASRRK